MRPRNKGVPQVVGAADKATDSESDGVFFVCRVGGWGASFFFADFFAENLRGPLLVTRAAP
jgi:hypothetical protein